MFPWFRALWVIKGFGMTAVQEETKRQRRRGEIRGAVTIAPFPTLLDIRFCLAFGLLCRGAMTYLITFLFNVCGYSYKSSVTYKACLKSLAFLASFLSIARCLGAIKRLKRWPRHISSI